VVFSGSAAVYCSSPVYRHDTLSRCSFAFSPHSNFATVTSNTNNELGVASKRKYEHLCRELVAST